MYFFSLPFLGWKLEGCQLPLQLQNQQEHFQMPSGSRILASCHVLYDISIFSTLPEWERQKEKNNKEKQVQFQHSSNEQRLPVVQNDFVVWWDICLYNITGLSFLWHNPAMWSEGKTVSNGSLFPPSIYRTDIWVHRNGPSPGWPLLFSSRPWVSEEQTAFAKFTAARFTLLHLDLFYQGAMSERKMEQPSTQRHRASFLY